MSENASPMDLPRAVWARPLRIWLALGLGAAFAMGLPGGRAPSAGMIGVALACGATLAALGAQSSVYLGMARRGAVQRSPAGPPYRLWRHAPQAWGAAWVGGGPGVGVGVGLALLGLPRLAWALGAVGVVSGVFWRTTVGMRRTLAVATAPRSDGLMRWLLLDTALPAGLLAGGVGVGIAWVRLGGAPSISGATLAKHLAATLLVSGVLLGPAGAIKTGRERASGLVRAPVPHRQLPGPIVSGLTGSLLLLVLGPHLLPTLSLAEVLPLKLAFSALAGAALTYLGARRGASTRAPADETPPA